jgi:N-methylhydantoinase A/oxoprolinase/acetone carboxylase beta subunit
LACQIGIDKAISFDMGGTTAKASIIENGVLSRALEYAVGGGVMIGSRLLSGAGYTLKVPAIDLAEVGAGAGPLSGSMPAARCRSDRRAPALLRARCATTAAAPSPP